METAEAIEQDRLGYAAGLEMARQLVDKTGVRDPAQLLDAARLVESRATTTLELGVAAGLRLLAEDFAAG